jgi:hypothetical protein
MAKNRSPSSILHRPNGFPTHALPDPVRLLVDVGLEMPECNPMQAIGRHDAAQCTAIDRKHFSETGMEHQRLVAEN